MATQATQKIPKRWKEITLGKIAELSKSQWNPGDKEEKYIGLEHINQGELGINGFGYSSKLESNKFYFKTGDVLFGKLRPYFRKVWKAKFDGVCSTDIWVLKAKENNDQNFLFYFVANPAFIDISMGANTGTHMPRADWSFLENTEWKIPPLPEQRAIAAILSSLDNKIELLREQNKTLEATAQTIFKEWFLVKSDKLPKGWKIGKLGDIADISTGKAIDKSALKSNGLYQVLGANGEIGKTDKFLFDVDLILTGRVGTLGKVYLSKGRVWISDNVLVSKSKSKEDYYFVYFQIKRINFDSLNRGSTQPLVTQTDLKNVEIVLPEQKVLKTWHIAASSQFEKIFNNNSQIQTLSGLRDTILPKLMRGKIRVKEFSQ